MGRDGRVGRVWREDVECRGRERRGGIEVGGREGANDVDGTTSLSE